MAGARQLLRELVRERRASCSSSSHLTRAVADFSLHTYQNEPRSPSNQRLHGLADDRAHDFPPPRERAEIEVCGAGMSRCLPRVMGSLVVSKVLPKIFSGDSSRSFTTVHVGSSACSTLSRISPGGTLTHRCHNFHGPAHMGRYCSTVSGSQLEDELGGFGKNVNATTADVTGTLASSEAAQAMSEVSAIIGDCSYPTAFLQIFMDTMHTHLGLPWWGAIVAATIGIRLLCLPIVAFQMKSTAKLTLMRPKMESINERIKASNYDPGVALEGRQQILALFKEYKTTPLSPFIGGLLQAPIFISFFFALQNMCQRLESFKYGGFLMFTDLTAKDSTYILPITLSAAMLLAVELNAMEGIDGNPHADKMKLFLRIFAVALCPISMNFETALFCYWIPSNILSICQTFLFKQKAVKKFVGIPSTEHLAKSSTVKTPVEPVLPDPSTINPVKKKLTAGRSKVKGSRRR